MWDTQLTRNHRIVFAYTSGLHRIIGCSTDEQPPIVLTEPQQISEFLASKEKPQRAFGLIHAYPRYLLYREIAPPEGLGTFDRRQQ